VDQEWNRSTNFIHSINIKLRKNILIIIIIIIIIIIGE